MAAPSALQTFLNGVAINADAADTALNSAIDTYNTEAHKNVTTFPAVIAGLVNDDAPGSPP